MDLTWLPFRFPGISGVRCAFGTRPGGNISLEVPEAADDPGPAIARREAMLRELGLTGAAEARQVHGVRTLFDPEPQDRTRPPVDEADGLATARPGLGLMLKTADCQPLLLAHASGRYAAALHVGWKGNRQNYPAMAVAELCARWQVRPDELSAVRGPSLGPGAAEFTGFEAEWGDAFRPWFDPAQRTMDLWRLTRDQLCAAGLRPDRIYGLDFCTLSLSERFFSFRHDRSCGRQASVIVIDPA